MNWKLFALMLVVAGMAIPAASQNTGLEFGAAYNYVHTNAPPGGCTCFGMNGGSGWAAYRFTPKVAAVAELSSQHASNTDGSGADLTLTSVMFGPRLQLRNNARLKPFGQALIGFSHASGSFAPSKVGFPGSDNSFSAIAGGGVDVSLQKGFSLRLIEVDYFATQFPNGVNDHQNNLRLSFGVLWQPKRK